MADPLITSETNEQGRVVWKVARLEKAVPEMKALLEAEAQAASVQNRAAIVFSPQGLDILFKLNAEYVAPLQAELKKTAEALVLLRGKKAALENKLEQTRKVYRIWSEASMREEAFQMDEDEA